MLWRTRTLQCIPTRLGNRRVPTYTKSQITPLKNNYNGATPDPGYISGWNLTIDGLDSGLSISLDVRNLMNLFSVHEQITRLVCVEGWSAIAWCAGFRFDDLLRAYPPMSQAKWVRVESSVNLDDSGNPDPYFMSIDLATAVRYLGLGSGFRSEWQNGKLYSRDCQGSRRWLQTCNRPIGYRQRTSATNQYSSQAGASRIRR